MPRNTPSAQAEVPDEASHLREQLFLAEQGSEAGITVLPSSSWSVHYPAAGTARDEILKQLMDGKLQPSAAAASLKPDALLYDTNDIDRFGMETMIGKIRDVTARMKYYDYEQFADFMSSMGNKTFDAATAEEVYDSIARSRIRKIVVDAYGSSGKKQIENALRGDAARLREGFELKSCIERVLCALQMHWQQTEGYIDPKSTGLIDSLSPSEKSVFTEMKDSFADYVRSGTPASYRAFVEAVQRQGKQMKRLTEDLTPEMQDLVEELEQIKKDMVPPGMQGDSAVVPDDQDEYHTPFPGQESREQGRERMLFEITPAGESKVPMVGYYCKGRKSYYNPAEKTWSKKKQLTPYTASITGTARQRIGGNVDTGLKALPIPNGYALDTSSLQASSGNVRFFRDQTGCFYVQASTSTSFTVDFLAETPPKISAPVSADLELLTQSPLSQKTEAQISQLQGTNTEKAMQAQQYVTKQHFYPMGGERVSAQALQWKLRHESTPDNYIQNIDASEYLECYSSNELFVHMMRKANVPARLVFGHHVETAEEVEDAIITVEQKKTWWSITKKILSLGLAPSDQRKAIKVRAVISDQTGHAWSEIWDGKLWRRFDATPPPKPQDKNPGDHKDGKKKVPGENANDDGIDMQRNDMLDELKKRVSNQAASLESDMRQATTEDMEEAKESLQELQKKLEQMEQQKQELEEKMTQSQSFKELQHLQQEMEKLNLFTDMKQEMREKLEAKKAHLKEQAKEQLERAEQDGFIDEQKQSELQKQLEGDLDKLSELQKQLEKELKLHHDYEAIRSEVDPFVEHWFRYFAEKLPREPDVSFDEDSRTRQGRFDRRSIMRPRNLMFGTIKNPRVLNSSIKPRFIAHVVLDVSGSMEGKKLENARKMLVFFCELFTRISQEYGYIRFAIHTFSDSITEIKRYNDEYDSPERYDVGDKKKMTVKVRLMKNVDVQGGTNMYPAIKKAAKELDEEVRDYPDHASAMYFFGDGEDTCDNSENIKHFLKTSKVEGGFGAHLRSATVLGGASDRKILAELFGKEHTVVANDLETMIHRSMEQFSNDIEPYVERFCFS